MATKTKRSDHEKAVDAEAFASGWLADGNEALARGQKARAERCYDKAQYWLDRANKLRGLA